MYLQQIDNEILGGGGWYICYVYKMILCEWQFKLDFFFWKKFFGNII